MRRRKTPPNHLPNHSSSLPAEDIASGRSAAKGRKKKNPMRGWERGRGGKKPPFPRSLQLGTLPKPPHSVLRGEEEGGIDLERGEKKEEPESPDDFYLCLSPSSSSSLVEQRKGKKKISGKRKEKKKEKDRRSSPPSNPTFAYVSSSEEGKKKRSIPKKNGGEETPHRGTGRRNKKTLFPLISSAP